MAKKKQLQLLRILTHVGSLIPLAVMAWDFYFQQLGPEPIRELTFRTGKTALILLFLSLACTPVSTLGWKIILPLRKPLGLYGFLYVCFHLAIFVVSYGVVSNMLQRQYVWEEALFRRYAVVGLIAFALLVPLAATSTNWAMRKMGKNWKRLHRLVYVVAILAVIHYFWLAKLSEYNKPIFYAVILAVLFLFRLPPVRQRLLAWRK
jgi:sulfoxide reductase heme-binding subunit YedZ